MFGLAHADFGWIIAGIVVFIGIMFFIAKIIRGQLISATLSMIVWIFVFTRSALSMRWLTSTPSARRASP